MTQFAEHNGFFFYTKAETIKKMRALSPVLHKNESVEDRMDSSEAFLARQGSYLYKTYDSPDHDIIAKKNLNPQILKWKADILKLIKDKTRSSSKVINLSPERKSPERRT